MGKVILRTCFNFGIVFSVLFMQFVFNPFSVKAQTVATCSNSGLIAHWKLNETSWTSAGQVKDSSGFGHHGTSYGARPVAGLFGNAGYFDGNDYIKGGNIGSVSNWTVMFWMYSESGTNFKNPFDANLEVIKSTDVNTNIGPRFEQSHAWFNQGYHLVLMEKVYKIANVAPTNRWVHTAVVRDGNNLRIYLDGQKVVSTTNTAWPSSFENVGMGVGFGIQQDRYFKGKLDGVRIYNRGLGSTQVADCARL